MVKKIILIVLLVSIAIASIVLTSCRLAPDRGVETVEACPAKTVNIISDNQGQKSTYIQKVTGETEEIYNENTKTCSSKPTLSKTETTAGFWGTDLGTSFDHKGKTYVLFGDTPKILENTVDYGVCPNSIAVVDDILENGEVKLEFLLGESNSFLQLTVQGEELNCFDVPLDGVSNDDTVYVWFSDDNGDSGDQFKQFYRSMLAKSSDPTQPFTKVYDLSFYNNCLKESGEALNGCQKRSGKFAYVTAEIFNSEVYLFGAGEYRGSDIYLAKMPLSKIEDKSSIQYFTGLDNNCQAKWESNEAQAVKVIDTPSITNPISEIELEGCAGEISVTYNKDIDTWIAMYNCIGRIVLHSSQNPEGPWSEGQPIFNRFEEGHCNFINSKECSSCLDERCSKDDRCEIGMGPGGGAYGPYPITSTPDGNGGVIIDYFMSTWNPYNVVQMRTNLRPD